MIRRLALLALAFATPVGAQTSPPPRAILFVGNSFTFGANSAVRYWRASSVNDLNGYGFGGVPALFKAFTDEAGLSYTVSLETEGGKTLGFHYRERRQQIDRRWDAVVLQEYSTLDPQRPGNPANYVADVGRLGRMFASRNPNVQVYLTATWTRADQTYRPGGRWYGRPVAQMAQELRVAADLARASTPQVAGISPVGEAWNRAFAGGIADPNPYDGVSFGQLDLWSWDQYHASAAGYYLEALVVFGRVSGVDPRTLGRGERAAEELGFSQDQTTALQRIASEQLAQR